MNLLEYKAGRGFIAFAFYFAEGAPIGFIWWAMPTILRQAGVEVNTIASFTAILTLPWVLKFLWAPLVDMFRSSHSGFTKWIAWSQLFMCLSLFPLIFIPITGNVLLWGVLLLLNSIFAATQDVAVDALVINVIAKQEKGILNGFMQGGMLLGRSIFGGVALMFIPQFGLPFTISLMIACILVVTLLLLFIKEPNISRIQKDRFTNFKNNIKETYYKKQTWYVIAFALTAAAAFESVGGMSGVYFTDKQVDSKIIGFFFSIPVVVAMLIGGVAGGFLSDKMSRKKSVIVFLCGFVFTIICISFTGFFYPSASHISLLALFAWMYFFIGMFTTSSYALFMDVTNPKLGATEFSLFMAATNACESWVVWLTGILVVSFNYSSAFLIMSVVSLSSLFFLRKIKI